MLFNDIYHLQLEASNWLPSFVDPLKWVLFIAHIFGNNYISTVCSFEKEKVQKFCFKEIYFREPYSWQYKYAQEQC